jgi:hypothetical protein
MATISQVTAKMAGTVLVGVAATAGPDKVLPGDAGGVSSFVLVQNLSGSPITVTIADPGKTKYQLANPSIVTTAVPATTGLVIIGPIPPDLKQSDGTVNLTASLATSVTFFGFRA